MYISIFFKHGVVNKRTSVIATMEKEVVPSMYKKLKCPVCGKRACDISDLPKEKIYIELKCPHCNKLVKIPCVKSAVKTA